MINRRRFIAANAAALAGLAAGIGIGKPLAGAEPKHTFKLKYAPNLGLLRNISDEIDRLDAYADYGFRAFEFNGLLSWDTARAEKLRARMDKLGLTMGVFVGNPSGWDKAGMVNPEQRPAFLEEVKKSVTYHKIVGNVCSTVITGPGMEKPPRGLQRAWVIESLKRAADLVAGTKLVLVVEPLNNLTDHPGYFLSRSDEAYEVMKAVNSPQIKILFDIYHQQITEGNLTVNIRQFYEEIGYFQLADVPGRHEPGTGEINYRNVFKAIYDLGYKGVLGLELSGSVRQDPEGSLKVFESIVECDKFAV
ncbi:MAG: TIM barrel protein [Candidatus Glassbacteria bacterium]